MWWGRGDTSQLSDDVRTTLDHLRRLSETGHVTTLDARQAEVALRAVDFFSQWESVLKLMNSLKNVALLVGALLAIYWAAGDALTAWVRSVAGG